MTFNEPIARAALAAIRANPSEWDQEVWRCGTGQCFAGFVAFQSGARWATTDPYDEDGGLVVTPDGEYEHVADFAARVLGVDTDPDGDMLFDAWNSLDDLERLIGSFAADPVPPPATVPVAPSRAAASPPTAAPAGADPPAEAGAAPDPLAADGGARAAVATDPASSPPEPGRGRERAAAGDAAAGGPHPPGPPAAGHDDEEAEQAAYDARLAADDGSGP